jgi:hypothetical protein
MAQFRDSSHDTLTIPDHPVAVHVTSKYDKAKFCELGCSAFGVVVETRSSVNDQESRTLPLQCVIEEKQPGEFCIAIPVPNFRCVYFHPRPFQLRQTVRVLS